MSRNIEPADRPSGAGWTARRFAREAVDGADEGNRTPVSSLGSLRSAIEPHPPERPGGRSWAHSSKGSVGHFRPPPGHDVAPASVAGSMSGPPQQPGAPSASPSHEPGVEPSPMFWPNLLS